MQEEKSTETRLAIIELKQAQMDDKLSKIDEKLDKLIQEPAQSAKKYKWLIIGFVLESIFGLVVLGAGTWVVKTSQSFNQPQVISESR